MSRKQYSHCGLIASRLDISHQMSGISRQLLYSYCGLIAWMFLNKCLEYLENNIHIVVSLVGCLEVGGVSPKPISG